MGYVLGLRLILFFFFYLTSNQSEILHDDE